VRSPAEIKFRLRQEAANALLFTFPPALKTKVSTPLKGLPDPAPVAAGLRDTPYGREVLQLADQILLHQIPLFGQTMNPGSSIDWRKDYAHSISTPLVYFRRLPYLDFSRCGDHKYVWELNRHQHLVLLAQAWRLSGDPRYCDELRTELEHWCRENPFQQGINWTSALEVAFRALSWIWIWHLAGDRLPGHFLTELYRHGLHLEYNLSIYFSPNTHLLGEAVALHALGVLFPEFPHAAKWRRIGREVVDEEMRRQVRGDGSHFEQSSYYHVYALDLFLLRHILEPASKQYQDGLRNMAVYLAALLGPRRRLPFLGDDDGGRMFHPYGNREEFGRATLATAGILFPDGGWSFSPEDVPVQAAWWLGESACSAVPSRKEARNSRLFPDSGSVVMEHENVHLIARVGPMGAGRSGHSHADALSFVLRCGEEDVLLDPGTFTYVGDSQLRDWFRGTPAHNTVSVNGQSQALPVGPFGWKNQPTVRVLEWKSEPNRDVLDAVCECGWKHRRRIVFLKKEMVILILDEVEGSGVASQNWHTVAGSSWVRFAFCGGEPAEEAGWRSRVFGSRIPTSVIRHTGTLPLRLAAAIDVSASPTKASLSIHPSGSKFTLRWSGTKVVEELF
jgi:hypothetical protein